MVNKNFDLKNRIELIKICGHYILSNYDFINRIKIKFKNIDTLIVNKIINKLNKLHGYRPKTIICDIDGTIVKHELPIKIHLHQKNLNYFQALLKNFQNGHKRIQHYS